MQKMFNKFISVILCVVIVFGSASLAGFLGLESPDLGSLLVANAQESPYGGKCGENLYWELDSYKYYPNNYHECELYITGTGEMTDFDDFKNSAPWDHESNNIVSVHISEGITSIGDNAFFELDHLNEITIPDSVTRIGRSSFNRCSLLSRVKLPKNLKSVGEHAFSGCTFLSTISYPGNLADWCAIEFGNPNSNPISIAYNFYADGTAVNGDIVIPNTVTSINDYAFNNYRQITSVAIPESTENIGKAAFSGCSKLSKIIVDSENPVYSSDEDGVLFDKNKTELLQYPANNTKTKYSIPDSVTSIGDYAFYDCKKLTSITIPDGVTSIGDYAFANCPNLTIIIIPDSVTSIGKNAFSNCRVLSSVTFGGGVKTIGEMAFYSCKKLTNVTIPDSVTSIGDSAFMYCDELVKITIGDGVTCIGDSAFKYCDSIISITIPDSVMSIGEDAFFSCSALTTIIIGGGSIGKYAFMYCDSLTSVTIGNGVTSIGDFAFYTCDNITDVIYEGTGREWFEISIGTYNDNLTRRPRYYSYYYIKWLVDGNVTEQRVRVGANIESPKPKKDYYTFVGWDSEVPQTMPEKSLTFNAKFIINTYYAEFVVDNKVVATVPYTYKTESIKEPKTPYKEGYTGVWETYELIPGGITINAEYKINTHTVTWITDGKEIVDTYNYGDDIFTPNDPQKEGCTFTGWAPSVPATVPDNNLTFTATWKKNFYTIKWNIDGEVYEETVEFGSVIIPPVPKKAGYAFVGWDKTVPGTMPSESLSFTAKFKFAAQVSIKNNSDTKTINYGETLRLTANATNMPDGAKIYWYVEGEKKGEGDTFNISFESGTKLVEVKLVDANGNVLQNESGVEIKDFEKVTVKSGFFQKLISFFKNLFGSNRTVIQTIFSIEK